VKHFIFILATQFSFCVRGRERSRRRTLFPRMNMMTIDIRAAAAAARAFADSAGSAELKKSFYAMARRWEAEADRREEELDDASGTSMRRGALACEAPAGD